MDAALYAFALRAMNAMDPAEARRSDHEVFASAIATVLPEERPLYRGDDDRLKTASFVLAVASRESNFRPVIHGDCSESKPGEPCRGKPHSYCGLQVHDSNGGSEALNEDPNLCVRVALGHMRTSFHVCPAAPLAQYVVGGDRDRACSSERGKRVSLDRTRIAERIYARRQEFLALAPSEER